MRQVTSDAVDAFLAGRDFRRDNTEVFVDPAGAVRMFLFGHQIAHKHGDRIDITNAGHTTQTTKERLNGVLFKLGEGWLYQEKKQWYWLQALGRRVPFPEDEWVQVRPGNVFHELSEAAGEQA